MISQTNLSSGVDRVVMIEYFIPEAQPIPLNNTPMVDDNDPHTLVYKFVIYCHDIDMKSANN